MRALIFLLLTALAGCSDPPTAAELAYGVWFTTDAVPADSTEGSLGPSRIELSIVAPQKLEGFIAFGDSRFLPLAYECRVIAEPPAPAMRCRSGNSRGVFSIDTKHSTVFEWDGEAWIGESQGGGARLVRP